jgi:signal transduction histidine kinase
MVPRSKKRVHLRSNSIFVLMVFGFGLMFYVLLNLIKPLLPLWLTGDPVYYEMFTLTSLTVIASGLILVWKKSEEDRISKHLEKRLKNDDIIKYLSSLDLLKSDLLSQNDTQGICKILIQFFKEVFQTDSVHIYLWREETGAYRQEGSEGEIDTDYETFFPVYHEFLLWMSDHPSIYLAQEFQNLAFHRIQAAALDFFEKSKSSLVMPFVLNSSLLGFVTLGQKKTPGSSFDLTDIERLGETNSVIVMSLSNANFYRQLMAMTETLEAKVKERTRALEEAQTHLVMSEKMASLGVMVAGIAHEINTPAGAIKASCENLETNVNYCFYNVQDLTRLIRNKKLRGSFFRMFEALTRQDRKEKINPSSNFKIKKELINRFKNEFQLSNEMASELAQFLTDNNVTEMQDDVVTLVQNDRTELFQLLRSSMGVIRNIKNINYAISNIVRIVKALKYYSHLDMTSYVEAEIMEGIENTLIIHNNQIKQGIEVRKNFKQVPKVTCNIDELNQVWTNIINNAIHAMKKIESPILTLNLYQEDNFVVVEIGDNGSGIPVDVQARMWDPFFTTKDQGEGTGLGLGIVKGIIDKHKGKIEVRSVPGETVFKISIPIQRQVT